MQTYGEHIKQSVIIVGTSPSILEQENGHIIDQFHKVIRAGHFVIEGYEKFVGTRTDCNITRNKKYDQLSPHSRETINEFMIVPAVSERSLGLCAIDYCIETYPAHQLYVAGFTLNLASHMHRKTKYKGKYYDLDYTAWDLTHNLVKEDIYINKLICKSKIKIL